MIIVYQEILKKHSIDISNSSLAVLFHSDERIIESV